MLLEQPWRRGARHREGRAREARDRTCWDAEDILGQRQSQSKSALLGRLPHTGRNFLRAPLFSEFLEACPE